MPFGRVLVQPAREPDIPPSEDQEEGYTLEYWDRVVPYGEAIVSPNLGVIRIDGRPLDGLVYTSLEIFPDAAETYFPLRRRQPSIGPSPNFSSTKSAVCSAPSTQPWASE